MDAGFRISPDAPLVIQYPGLRNISNDFHQAKINARINFTQLKGNLNDPNPKFQTNLLQLDRTIGWQYNQPPY